MQSKGYANHCSLCDSSSGKNVGASNDGVPGEWCKVLTWNEIIQNFKKRTASNIAKGDKHVQIHHWTDILFLSNGKLAFLCFLSLDFAWPTTRRLLSQKHHETKITKEHANTYFHKGATGKHRPDNNGRFQKSGKLGATISLLKMPDNWSRQLWRQLQKWEEWAMNIVGGGRVKAWEQAVFVMLIIPHNLVMAWESAIQSGHTCRGNRDD